MEIAVGIIKRDNCVLMIERREREKSANNEELSWVFPGGKIEKDETPFMAAEREVHEETGYLVTASQEIDQRQHPSFDAYIHYISCDLSFNVPKETSDSAVSDVKWVPINEIDLYITSSLNQKIKEYLLK